jgi:hypothetical protein
MVAYSEHFGFHFALRNWSNSEHPDPIFSHFAIQFKVTEKSARTGEMVERTPHPGPLHTGPAFWLALEEPRK